ncbi:penicillin-insensitive murein endopeptidase [Microvirga antarctica]|uniref:penicillin-insensitive murein endopeptidase n=1 Tax=Microvirga antarctica TaxID=2819233 RepID=UPI001B30A3E6|nr:penicillin-insensitive murein endopeptidase [Microvirga antarctica]
MNTIRCLVAVSFCLVALSASAQDKGTLNPKPLPPLANPDSPTVAAKELFGRAATAAALQPQAIGSYARGCVAGAAHLPIDGDTWQVMRLSRNRNWGHPDLIRMLQRLSSRLPQINGWSGLLVGDISQPRGGPMITGHASHQVGLDADIWLRPMPDRRLTRAEREEMSATDMVRSDLLDINPSVWTPQHTALIKAAASEPSVARVFVNAAIKKALCREAGADRGWLTKVRPIFGHNYHFHIRIACPAGNASCADQDPPPSGDGCGAELSAWFTPQMLHPTPGKPRPPLTMAQLPAECRRVLQAP